MRIMRHTEIMEGQISDAANGKPVILIVEDNEDLRKYISRNLENNYSILFAENGRVGLNNAPLKTCPTWLYRDLMMPDNGRYGNVQERKNR